jgi:hypothetical protein
VCNSRVSGNQGLDELAGSLLKRPTTHWFYVEGLREPHPAIQYVADHGLWLTENVATRTGSSPSMPMALTLIEAIGGRDKAQAVGRDWVYPIFCSAPRTCPAGPFREPRHRRCPCRCGAGGGEHVVLGGVLHRRLPALGVERLVDRGLGKLQLADAFS